MKKDLYTAVEIAEKFHISKFSLPLLCQAPINLQYYKPSSKPSGQYFDFELYDLKEVKEALIKCKKHKYYPSACIFEYVAKNVK